MFLLFELVLQIWRIRSSKKPGKRKLSKGGMRNPVNNTKLGKTRIGGGRSVRGVRQGVHDGVGGGPGVVGSERWPLPDFRPRQMGPAIGQNTHPQHSITEFYRVLPSFTEFH